MNDEKNSPMCNGCDYTKITSNNPLSNKRKLILHFDNRNTLQVRYSS